MVKIRTAEPEEVTYVRNYLDDYCGFICDLGYRSDSTHRREVNTFIVSFSFGAVGVEFDYGEWVMRKAVLSLVMRDKIAFFDTFIVILAR